MRATGRKYRFSAPLAGPIGAILSKFYRVILSRLVIHPPSFVQIDPVSEEIIISVRENVSQILLQKYAGAKLLLSTTTINHRFKNAINFVFIFTVTSLNIRNYAPISVWSNVACPLGWSTTLVFRLNSVELMHGRIYIAVLNDLLLKEFQEHLLSSEHRMAEMSATPETLAALANKIQTRPKATVLRESAVPSW